MALSLTRVEFFDVFLAAGEYVVTARAAEDVMWVLGAERPSLRVTVVGLAGGQ